MCGGLPKVWQGQDPHDRCLGGSDLEHGVSGASARCLGLSSSRGDT